MIISLTRLSELSSSYNLNKHINDVTHHFERSISTSINNYNLVSIIKSHVYFTYFQFTSQLYTNHFAKYSKLINVT